MRADATCVAAAVTLPSRPPAPVLALLRRRLRRLDGRVLPFGAAILLLAAAICTVLWAEREHKGRSAVADAIHRIELVSSLAALEIERLASGHAAAEHLSLLERLLPAGSLDGGRFILLADPAGDVVGAAPNGPVASELPRLFGRGAMWGDGSITRIVLSDGSKLIGNVRTFRGGHLAVLQPVAAIRASNGTLARKFGWSLALLGVGLAAGGTAFCLLAPRPRPLAYPSRATRRLETALNRGRCGLWDWDIRRGRIVWSSSLFDILGYQAREGLSVGEVTGLIHPADCDLFAIAAKVVSGECSQIDHEFRVRKEGGGWLWLRARAEVVHEGPDGAPHLVGIAMDVTGEREASAIRAAADDRLRDAVEAISEAFVLWDAEDRLILCNSRFRQLHELSPELVEPGTAYADIVEGGRSPRIEREVGELHVPRLGSRTLEAQLADGRWLHINERRTADGGYVSVGTDITELKRQQEKLVASEQRLTGYVRALKRSQLEAEVQAQRLADLAERYHEQRDAAESASRAKTEFLAKMSHELRTPLNAILGFADVMRNQYLGPIGSARYAEYANDIHASGRCLLGFIDNILRMSKIDAGTYELNFDVVDMPALLRSSVGCVLDEAEAKELRLSADFGDAATLRADGGALRLVFSQLLRNAVQFARPGGAITLRARRAEGALHVFVADDGVGMPAAFLQRVGTPFEQVETEYNRSAKGCGLGLALAKALTELHDGSLRIRSQEGVGTVVLVRLPLPQPLPARPSAAPARVWLEAAE